MITISLCMIVKNEEKTLENCLNSVKGIVDEIIIADTGSTDRTKEIATKYTDKVFDFEWVDDFSAARNFSFKQASKDYIMWLDADDIIKPGEAEKIIKLKNNIPAETDVVMMMYDTGFDKKGRVTFSCYRERLIKRSRGFEWVEPVHECIHFGGKIVNSEIRITHTKGSKPRSDRNIKIYEKWLSEGKKLTYRGMYYYARELKEHKRYTEAIKWFTDFLDTGKGWVEDSITACEETAVCYQAINKPDEALAVLFRSFNFETPRAELCCRIGYHFKDLNKYKQAAFWFELALKLEKPKINWGFRRPDCWGYIPLLECAVCYDKLGEYEKAANFNDMAAEINPESTAAQQNKLYFNQVLSKRK